MARKQTATNVSFFAFQDIITSVVGIFLLITLIMALNSSSPPPPAGARTQRNLASTIEIMEKELQAIDQAIENVKKIPAPSLAVSKGRRQDLDIRLRQILQSQEKFDNQNQKTTQAIEMALAEWNLLKEKSVDHDQKKEELDKLMGELKHLETLAEAINSSNLAFNRSKLGRRGLAMVEIKENEISIVPLGKQTPTTFSSTDALEKSKVAIKPLIDDCHLFVIVRPKGIKNFNRIRSFLNAKQASYGFDVSDDGMPLLTPGGK